MSTPVSSEATLGVTHTSVLTGSWPGSVTASRTEIGPQVKAGWGSLKVHLVTKHNLRGRDRCEAEGGKHGLLLQPGPGGQGRGREAEELRLQRLQEVLPAGQEVRDEPGMRPRAADRQHLCLLRHVHPDVDVRPGSLQHGVQFSTVTNYMQG
ncbi:hypothetical protein MATL_G00219230 [Megalops atlanticus]|uniref:Uncharacterized protein n=1 Tax=Megalops atlanticus TaxID=7932 RepID=A0A9D3PLX0_MEGAT|nr:hypothetical protein MATL_G00219230 [Megalops atlanticus]